MTKSLHNLIVPVLNRYDLLDRLLDSITYPVKHLLIVDNGGQLNFTRDLPFVEKLTVLNMPANLGVSGSWNLGVKSFPHDDYWAFASNDAVFHPGTLSVMADTKPDDMLMSQMPPHWQVFTIGCNVMRYTGLWCEGFHPAYFEDNDFIRRASHFGFHGKNVLDVGHDNSSTLHSDPEFQKRNASTFNSNRQLYLERQTSNDLTEGSWSLDRRRALEWLR